MTILECSGWRPGRLFFWPDWDALPK